MSNSEVAEKVHDWLRNGRTGLSSTFIAAVILNTHPSAINGTGGRFGDHPDHPHDAGDFGRCEELLSRSPGVRAAAYVLMPAQSPTWARLIDSWDIIADLIGDGYDGYATGAIRQIIDAPPNEEMTTK